MPNRSELSLEKYEKVLEDLKVTEDSGKVIQVTGQLMRGYLPGACVGSICTVYPTIQEPFSAEVVGFQDRQVLLMPIGEMRGVGLGSRIVLKRQHATVKVGHELLGRVINSMGEPIDGLGALDLADERPLYSAISNPLSRPPIHKPLDLGVRAINGMLTVGQGQRVGIMAGSGVGKSVLMGMIAKSTKADINVIALVGERGREVREFIETNLGPEGLRRSVVVVATSDQSPLVRMRGAFTATAIAEHFCEQGMNVLLMMDSVTRFAMAQREIGLSTGEPPASKGYTPSVFSLLPKLLERAGTFDGKGSITGLYTVLVEGDDMDEPIADSVRSIVDGHIVLSRSLAQKGHFPAIDILQSTSRVMRQVVSPEHDTWARSIRENLAIFSEAEDLINIGAYKMGANAKIDNAIQIHDQLIDFLRQEVGDNSDMTQTEEWMQRLYG
jgi:flagellum-specific ATP synthase